MEIRPHRIIKRKITKEIKLAMSLLVFTNYSPIGANAPTTDIKSTIKQINFQKMPEQI